MKSPIKSNEKQNRCQCNRDVGESECVVSSALVLVLRFTRCAGVAPLRIRSTRAGWLVTVSPSLAVLQQILMTVLNMVALAALILDLQEDPNRRIRVGVTAVTAFVWIFDLVLVMGISSLATYWGSTRMENFIRIIKQLQQINIDLNKDRCKKTERIGVVTAASMLIFTLVTSAAEFYVQFDKNIHQGFNWSIMAMYSVYYVAGVSGVLALMQWSYIVAEVHVAASALNHHLRRLLHEKRSICTSIFGAESVFVPYLPYEHKSFLFTYSTLFSGLLAYLDYLYKLFKLKTDGSVVMGELISPPKSVIDCFTNKVHEEASTGPNFIADTHWVQSMIHRLALSHEHIGEVMKRMHAGNGAFIMAVLLSTFLRLVVTPYYLALWLDSDDEDLTFAVLHVCFAILHIATLLLTIEPCHWTQAERETTKYLLSRLMVRLAPRNALLSRELEQFVKQTTLTDVKFAPLGLGTLARPYMSAILGGVLSYLVILLQFQMFAPSLNNRKEQLSTATNSKHSLETE